MWSIAMIRRHWRNGCRNPRINHRSKSYVLLETGAIEKRRNSSTTTTLFSSIPERSAGIAAAPAFTVVYVASPQGTRVASVKGMYPRPLDDWRRPEKIDRSPTTELVGPGAIEPPTSCMPCKRSPSQAMASHGGAGTLPERARFIKKMNELRAPNDLCSAQTRQHLKFTQNCQCGVDGR
jgi:hypothetical protein